MHLRKLSIVLASLLPFGALAPACSSSTTSTKGQMITCTTDPATGTILRCAPGEDDSSDSNTCHDIDEDGDGEPHDNPDGGPIILHGDTDGDTDDDSETDDDDDDDDGVSDEEDCDQHEGEDDDCDEGEDEIDLPYDVKPQLGATVRPIFDAFAEKGAQPAAIVSVMMDSGSSWRMTELQAGTAFTVTQADCDHAGNRDTGRDRVVVTWQNADGSTDSDHLDIRYCK